MAVSNSTGKEKLTYNDIRDLILVEEIRRKDAGESSGSGSSLNLEIRGRGNDKNSNRDRSKSRNSNRNRSDLDQAKKYNAGTMGKQVTLGINAKVLRRRIEIILLIL